MEMLSPEISVIVPCFNEEGNIAKIAVALISVLEKHCESFDIIFIDNASLDNSAAIIRTLCAADRRIKLIVNTRNFGQLRSPVHAVYATRGRAVIGIAADFQDPPELIEQFIAQWRGGADIVLGVRESERSSFLLGWTREIAYRFAQRFGDYPVVPNATGFGLYDRKVVSAIETLCEPEPFWRGLAIETGFKVETVLYERPIRARGRSSNNFLTLLDFSLSVLASFSKKTVRAPLYIGAVVAVLAGISLIAALAAWLMGAAALPWLIASGIELQFSMLFVALGVLGDQVRLISERTRKTPLVFEQERVNFPDGY
jgi:glycosyltransferase involved in cell wall biosynthesis